LSASLSGVFVGGVVGGVVAAVVIARRSSRLVKITVARGLTGPL
jgi:gas vesicle protein